MILPLEEEDDDTTSQDGLVHYCRIQTQLKHCYCSHSVESSFSQT